MFICLYIIHNNIILLLCSYSHFTCPLVHLENRFLEVQLPWHILCVFVSLISNANCLLQKLYLYIPIKMAKIKNNGKSKC